MDYSSVTAAEIGLYIHLPFCARRCAYCDFFALPWQYQGARELLPALLRHLEQIAATVPARPLTSIYIGGGTPSLWPARAIADLLKAASGRFYLTSGAEVTLEANPGSLSPNKVELWQKAGINRLSLGVQSFSREVLQAVGRRPAANNLSRTVRCLREGGIKNLSMDIIYALPGQTPELARRDLEQALDLQPEHLSLYELTLSPFTPLGRTLHKHQPPLPLEEEVIQMEDMAQELCAKAGLARYEVSNYCRSGYACRHNQSTWRGGDYLALGPGAHGHLAGERWAWRASVKDYCRLSANQPPPLEFKEKLTPRQRALELIMLGLRTTAGVYWPGVRGLLVSDPPEFLAAIQRLDELGWARPQGDWLKPTALGLRMADAAAALFA